MRSIRHGFDVGDVAALLGSLVEALRHTERDTGLEARSSFLLGGRARQYAASRAI